MILSEGTNQYPNNQFSFWEWSAPVLQTPEEVLQKLKELRLEGRIIKDIIAVGMGYGWTDDHICERAYPTLERVPSIFRKWFSESETLLASDFCFECTASIDEPLLIVFEDGDVLGISFDEGSSVRMELNTIPVTIEAGINYKNFHANRLFGDIIGKTVSEIWVNATSKEPDFTWSHGLDLEEQPLYIDEIMLSCHDITRPWMPYTLRFQAWFDFGTVELLDRDGKVATISAEQVARVVDGYMAAEFFQNVSSKKVAFLKWLRTKFGRKKNG